MLPQKGRTGVQCSTLGIIPEGMVQGLQYSTGQGVLPHPTPRNLTYVIALKLAKSTLQLLLQNTKLEM